MSRQRTLIRNGVKLFRKAWLSLLAMSLSASALANQLPPGVQIDAIQLIPSQVGATSRYLWEGSKAPEPKLSRYLWEGAKTSELTLSRYLWESSKAPEPKLSRYLWEGEKTSQLTLSRYLWEGSKATEPKLSRYLWEGEKTSQLTLSRYLWEGSKAPEPKLSRYLWEGEKTSELTLSRYLWEGTKTPERTLSRYLWTDDQASEVKLSARASVKMPITIGQSESGVSLARFLWREFDTVLPETQPKLDLLDDFMGQHYPAFLSDPRLQIASHVAMPSTGHETRQIALTGLNYSAKSAATLEFEGQIVRWSFVNQGLKPLEFSTLDLTVPDGAVLAGVAIKQAGLAPMDLGTEGSSLNLSGALLPGASATVEVTFVAAPSQDESEYAFNLAFKSGQTIEFLSRRNLPIQGERRDSFFPTLIRADELHRKGLTGRGVGVAVIDTGAWAHPALDAQHRRSIQGVVIF